MKYMVLQEGEMVSQIKQRILQTEKEHFALSLQLPQIERQLPNSKYTLLSSLVRLKKLEDVIALETEKLHGTQSKS